MKTIQLEHESYVKVSGYEVRICIHPKTQEFYGLREKSPYFCFSS